MHGRSLRHHAPVEGLVQVIAVQAAAHQHGARAAGDAGVALHVLVVPAARDGPAIAAVHENFHLVVAVEQERRLPERDIRRGAGADGDGALDAAEVIAPAVRHVRRGERDLTRAVRGGVLHREAHLDVAVVGLALEEDLRGNGDVVEALRSGSREPQSSQPEQRRQPTHELRGGGHERASPGGDVGHAASWVRAATLSREKRGRVN